MTIYLVQAMRQTSNGNEAFRGTELFLSEKSAKQWLKVQGYTKKGTEYEKIGSARIAYIEKKEAV